MAEFQRTRENSENEFEAPSEYINQWLQKEEENDDKENRPPAQPVKRKARWRRTREESENSELEEHWRKTNSPFSVKKRVLDPTQSNKLREIELWFENEAMKVQQQNSTPVVETWSSQEQNVSEWDYNRTAKIALQELQNFAFKQNQVAFQNQPARVVEAWNPRETLKETALARPVKRKLQWNESWHRSRYYNQPVEAQSRNNGIRGMIFYLSVEIESLVDS